MTLLSLYPTFDPSFCLLSHSSEMFPEAGHGNINLTSIEAKNK